VTDDLELLEAEHERDKEARAMGFKSVEDYEDYLKTVRKRTLERWNR